MKKTWKDTSKDYRRFLERRYRLLEDKTRFINNLDLTDDQKDHLKAFFKKYPNYESKIDWNRRDLKWEDFSELLANEGKSKSQAKKYGLSGLTPDKDYKIVRQETVGNYTLTIYYPLTFLASETLANPRVAPLGITGKWCISGGNYDEGTHDKYWNSYRDQEIDFFFVFISSSQSGDRQYKFAIARYPNNQTECFNSEDKSINLMSLVQFWCEVSYTRTAGRYVDYTLDESEKFEKMIEEYPRYLEDLASSFTPDGFKIKRKFDLNYLVAFRGKQAEVRIPENVDIIEGGVFSEKDTITSIFIPKNVSRIDDGAFYGCKSLQEVVFEKGSDLRVIPAFCFADCYKLKKVILPEKVFHIDNQAFSYCISLETIEWPKELKLINTAAFRNCAGLESIKLPDSLQDIRTDAFNNCESLKAVEFQGCQRIAPFVFYNCPSLETVILPKQGLDTVKSNAFRTTGKLDTFIYPGTAKEAFQSGTLVALHSLTEFKLKCIDGVLDLGDLF